MKKKMFNKYDIKNAIIEALLSRDIMPFLKSYYRIGASQSDLFYDTSCEIAEEIANRYFEQ